MTKIGKKFLDKKLIKNCKNLSKNISSEGFQISEWDFDASKLESGIYFAKLDVKSANKALNDNSNKIIKIAVINYIWFNFKTAIC